MKFSIRFVESKPKALEWVFILLFGLGLLIAAPFVAFAMFSEVIVCLGHAWIRMLQKVLDIEFSM